MTEGHDPSKPVGYGNPPKATQFKKGGKSRNPKGRPRKQKSLANVVEAEFAKIHKVRGENGKTQRLMATEILVKQLKNAALKGDPKAQKIVLDLLKTISPSHQILTPEEVLARQDEDQQRKELSARLLALMGQFSEAAGAALGTGVVQQGPDGELYVTALGLAIGEYVRRAGPEGPTAERRARIEHLLIQIDERRLEVRQGPPLVR
jgi:hypothetical protein